MCVHRWRLPRGPHRRWAVRSQLGPRLSAISRLVQAAFRAAADRLADRAPARIRRGVDDVGVLRIDAMSVKPVLSLMNRLRVHVAPPSVVLYKPRSPPAEQSGPCAATYTTSDARVDQDLADVLGLREAHALPGLARVSRLVDAVAEMRTALAGVFPGAKPSTLEFFGSISMQQKIVRALIVEQRNERRPRLTVFHNPPKAVAMYQVLGLLGRS